MTRVDLRRPSRPSSVPELRHAAVEFAKRHGVYDLHNVALAVSEAVTNAVLHARSSDVELEARAEEGEVVVGVRDAGEGMSPRVDSPGIGLGLSTIVSAADHVDIESDGGTVVWMRFARP
jgi:serine/threonine-protein kinase RsbW